MTSTFVSRANQWALTTLAVTAAGALLALAGMWQTRGLAASGTIVAELTGAVFTIVPYGLVGAVLIDRRPDLPFGWLLAAGAGFHTLFTAANVVLFLSIRTSTSGELTGPAWWLVPFQALGFVYLPIQGLINLRFPSGRLRGRWSRGLERVIVGVTALAVVAAALSSPADRGDTPLPGLALPANPLAPPGSALSRAASPLLVAVPLVALLSGAVGLAIVVRFLRATGLERQQLKWRAAHVLLQLALFPLAVTQHLPFDKADNVAFVLTLAVPVLRYRLWAIDTIISRSVAWASVTAVLTGLYAGVAVAGARLASQAVGTTLAVAAVVLAFGPLRSRAGQVVDRLFYGQRNEPYAALRLLGQRLRDVTAPGQVLPAVVEAVAGSLRLPYAAIERADGGMVLARSGHPGATTDRWPLRFEGRLVGWLTASPRRGEDRFDQRDHQLLDDVARQVASAVHAEALTADLLRSRQRLVTAREEERRRLRRDLHDGLGPVLAGVVLTLDAARTRLAGGSPSEAERLLMEAKEASTRAIGDLRQVVYGLRPPALDDLGLVGALRVQTARLATGTDLTVDLQVDDLPPLPAAVEVAAYRTVVEAVTNAVRHGSATRCTVQLRLAADPPGLDVAVTDDGVGAGPEGGPWVPGVGLTAMRERAEELGGTVAAGPQPAGGARVAARFPLPPDEAGVAPERLEEPAS